jgi:hypothetical protein
MVMVIVIVMVIMMMVMMVVFMGFISRASSITEDVWW